MTTEEIEKILGRKLKTSESTIFELYKDKSNYIFGKDKFGNLSVRKV